MSCNEQVPSITYERIDELFDLYYLLNPAFFWRCASLFACATIQTLISERAAICWNWVHAEEGKYLSYIYAFAFQSFIGNAYIFVLSVTRTLLILIEWFWKENNILV